LLLLLFIFLIKNNTNSKDPEVNEKRWNG